MHYQSTYWVIVVSSLTKTEYFVILKAGKQAFWIAWLILIIKSRLFNQLVCPIADNKKVILVTANSKFFGYETIQSTQ